MSSNKLHPIYVALDNHQYSRAVKLASSLPPSNVLGQALLAHALWKSGDVLKSLICIRGSLWFDSVELNYEIERLELSAGGSETTVAVAAAPTKKGKKGGGKGKKSGHGKSKGAAAAVVEEAPSQSQKDLVDHLATPLVLPEGWDQVEKRPDKQVITDETTLDTLAVTLQALRLYTTVYQLYASVTPPTLYTLMKTYTTGLYIMAFSSKYPEHVIASTLAGMQVMALQCARVEQEENVVKLWAAQTALWQLQFVNAEKVEDDQKTRQRLQMLPRLAETLSQKYSQTSVEATLLYIATLQQQDKHDEIVEVLTNSEDSLLTTHQRLELVATAHEAQEHWESAKSTYQQLLQEHPEQWSFWKSLLENAYRQGGVEFASETIQTQLDITKDDEAKYPVRARSLILCELAAVRVRGVEDSEDDATFTSEDIDKLQTALLDYGNEFGSQASCAFSDLVPYIELLVTSKKYESLLEWASQLLQNNKNAADRSILRAYIFAIQVTYKVLSLLNDKQATEKWLPKWEELVLVWRASQKLGTAKEGDDNVQKENQPGDELILLAVQNILFRNDTETSQLLTAAALLEEALQHSPYNAYLKISAIDVYARLNAVRRAWELFQGLSVKHIQLDSCSYLIFSKLVDGGMYNEAIQVANEILKFHGTTARDTGDYAGQAMEHGTLSKANEFLVFQRERMDPSLTLLEAKGRIMDCAQLLFLQTKKQAVGMQHGIAGEETDLERVTDMVREAHNPFGAPNILATASASYSDNRDMTILCYQILYKPTLPTKEQMVQDSIRRGLLHGLLVRLSLCLDVAKGPKKGKVTKASEVLQKRCSSLLGAINETNQFVDNETLPAGYKECMKGMLILCRVVSLVTTGVPESSEQEDTLANREQLATEELEFISIPVDMSWSVSDVSRYLPDMLVPLFVMLRITANLFALYGWGKRKCHTRASAAAVAKLANNLKTMVEAMHKELESLPDTDGDCTNKTNELLSLLTDTKVLDKGAIASVSESASLGQQLTRERVMPFLDAILDELGTFEVEES